MGKRRNFRRTAKKVIKTGESVAKVAIKAYNIAKKVSALVNVEFKFVDIDETPDMGTAGTVVLCTNIAQGDSSSERDGDQVKAKSWQTRLWIK